MAPQTEAIDDEPELDDEDLGDDDDEDDEEDEASEDEPEEEASDAESPPAGQRVARLKPREAPPPRTGKKGVPLAPHYYIGDLRIPGAAEIYKVVRTLQDGSGVETCAVQDGGERVEHFGIKRSPPSWQEIKANWGSGDYRLAWYSWDPEKRRTRPHGHSIRKVFDDPNFPRLPAYRQAHPKEEVAAAAPPAAMAMADPMAGIVQAIAGTGGTINAGVAVALISMMSSMHGQQLSMIEERQRRWRREDEDRATERENDHRRRLERERALAEEDRLRLDSFYRRVQSQPTRPADPELAELKRMVTDLTERQDDRDDDDDEGGGEKSAIDSLVEGALPVLMAKIMGGAGAPPPASGAPPS